MDKIALHDLIVDYAKFRDSHGKAWAILRGMSGITSIISSSIMIWMILRSNKGLSTTQHRLLLGLCIFDIILSSSHATFNALTPSDVDYAAWNAIGNEATCDTQGFLGSLGGVGGLLYNSSLNVYFLAVVKYEKKDEYIRTKIEPFLHGIPIVTALGYSISRLVKGHYNDDGRGSTPCQIFVNYPPHCQGYNIGEVRDGFEIPCGRGIEGARISIFINRVLLIMIPFLIIVSCLGIIHRVVRRQEKKLEKYGIAALKAQDSEKPSSIFQKDTTQSNYGSLLTSIKSSLSRVFKKTHNKPTIKSNNARSKSRAVMQKAYGYSFAWFLSFGIIQIGVIVYVATGTYPNAFSYLGNILNPLQGFFNLIIYMHPRIMATRRREQVSMYRAFIEAFWSRGNGKEKKHPRHTNLRGETEKVQGRIITGRFKEQKERGAQEEEKCEIQVPEHCSSLQKSTKNPAYTSNISIG